MNNSQITKLRRTLETQYQSSSILRETHISWIILVAEHAFKIKKPLALSFLDFSTLAQRKFYCERELQLNRRLAPQIYLGVLPLTQNNGHITVNGTGHILDYALHMQRMNDALLLSTLLTEKLGELNLRPLAQQLAKFHRSARRVFTQDLGERMNRAIDNILRVRSTVLNILGVDHAKIVDDCSLVGRRFVGSNIDYLQERSARGFIRECHGDLHSGNIIMETEPIIFDCLEFNDEYRNIDILSELAFLTMDLEAFNRPDLAQQFKEDYLAFSGEAHGRMEEKLYLYFKLYRANVRAKVAAIALQDHLENQAGPDSMFAERQKLSKYLHLVEQYKQQLIGSL